MDLHGVCAGFVGRVNALLSQCQLKLDPTAYSPESFHDGGANLFQINVRGRILQVQFQATEHLTSTEEFRIPYTLQGSVRCFNQELLDKDLIEEQLLFYCLEKKKSLWRFFDARTYRTGPFDQEYLISLMEQIV